MLGGMHDPQPDDPRPSYRQVADRLRTAIDDGRLAPGDQLPTHKALAQEFGVAVETVKRALNELRAAGVISSRQGKGTYVRAQPPAHQEEPTPPSTWGEAIDELRRELTTVKERLAALESLTRGSLEDSSTQARSAAEEGAYTVSRLPGVSH
jgi:DNA-binding GntR family transcriptional regulator